jgi:hypothetical protein
LGTSRKREIEEDGGSRGETEGRRLTWIYGRLMMARANHTAISTQMMNAYRLNLLFFLRRIDRICVPALLMVSVANWSVKAK